MQWPSALVLRRVSWLSLFGTMGFMVAFNVIHRPMAPYNILDYEFAWTPERAAEMFAAWGEAGQQAARTSLVIDFGFMPAYALLLASLALNEARLARAAWARRLSTPLRVQAAGRLGWWPVALPFGAWLLDAIENLALMRALAQAAQPPAAPLAVAGTAATVKFALLAACALYIVGAWAVRRWQRIG
jgi:hypothetical protein